MSIEENGVTRPKKYSELSVTEAIQADCDVKETNIILQGLPPEVYALVSNHKVTKELWERIQLLMQGTLLMKQERESTEAIQADCDVKAMNIILQGIPQEVYALVSTHKVSKDLWERIQMLMQGT
nr:hypothetical protein [Tanacetum cinerariifolium]